MNVERQKNPIISWRLPNDFFKSFGSVETTVDFFAFPFIMKCQKSSGGTPCLLREAHDPTSIWDYCYHCRRAELITDHPRRCWQCHRRITASTSPSCLKCQRVVYCSVRCQQRHKHLCIPYNTVRTQTFEDHSSIYFINGALSPTNERDWAPWSRIWRDFETAVWTQHVDPNRILVRFGAQRDTAQTYQGLYPLFTFAAQISDRQLKDSVPVEKHTRQALEWGMDASTILGNYLESGDLKSHATVLDPPVRDLMLDVAQTCLDYAPTPVRWSRPVPLRWYTFLMKNQCPWSRVLHPAVWPFADRQVERMRVILDGVAYGGLTQIWAHDQTVRVLWQNETPDRFVDMDGLLHMSVTDVAVTAGEEVVLLELARKRDLLLEREVQRVLHRTSLLVQLVMAYGGWTSTVRNALTLVGAIRLH